MTNKRLKKTMRKVKPRDYPKTPRVYEYELSGGWRVLAGKSDGDNDILSMKLAEPQDFWFHVRGMPGSHVLLKAKSEIKPGREILRQAASIAAFHSKAKNGGTVPVSCTRGKYVSKPRGAKPGTVSIRKEKILKVKPCLPE